MRIGTLEVARGSRRERASRRLPAQRHRFHIQRDGGNTAFRADLFRRFVRRESRCYLDDRFVTAFGRIESQHLAQPGKGQLDHLTGGDGHAALGVDFHYHMMDALALRNRLSDCQLLILRPGCSLRRGFPGLAFGSCRAAVCRVRQMGDLRS